MRLRYDFLSDKRAEDEMSQNEIVEVDPDIKSILPAFLRSLRDELGILRERIEQKDHDEIRRLSHKLKGRFSIVGFSRAARYCSQIEATSQTGEAVGLLDMLNDLQAYIERVQVVDKSLQFPNSKTRILVIDDDEKILEVLKVKIGSQYELVGVTNPMLAIQFALHSEPDLILCDIDMPEMNGGEVANLLSSHPGTAHIPFAYLTSFVSPSEVKALKGNVGGRPGIAKSTNTGDMVDQIEGLIAHR